MPHIRRYIGIFHSHLGARIYLFFVFTLLATMAESAGILALLPLLQGLDGGDVGVAAPVGRLVHSSLAMLGGSDRTILIFVLVAAFFLLKGAMLFCANAVNSRIVVQLQQGLKTELLERYSHMSYNYYVTKSTGHFINVMNGQINQMMSGFLSLVSVGSQFLNASIYVGVALFVAWGFGLMAFALGVAMLLLFGRMNKFVRRLSRQSAHEQAQLAKSQIQTLQAFKYLRSTGQLGDAGARISESIRNLAILQIRSGLAENFAKVVREPILVVLITMIVVVQISVLRQPLAPILVSIALFYRALGAMFVMQSAWLDFLGKTGAAEAVCDELEAQARHRSPDGNRIAPALSDSIVLRDLRFRYAPELDDVLDGIDMTIAARTSVALVGASGAGKSTVADILTLMLRPQSGSLLIDGVAADSLRLSAWRRQIGYVSQEAVIFDDTIANNIAMWQRDAPGSTAVADRVRDAARRACIAHFVEDLPDGYQTWVGDRGVRLSGGQKQRLFIARELYRKPKLLILDEATSALDSESERMIQKSIDSLKGHLTVVIIAHRLSTIRNVDRIFVLQGGRIVEDGSYEALREASHSCFGAMVDRQSM